jgi:DNA-binding transcriptional MerR regulator
MGWSTRELADMAGTTVNTIRHYHRVGLLDEPERRSNGYKQYQSWHLARVIQIRRLRDLGLPLTQVEQMGDGPSTLADALRVLDAELAASIERLQRARDELATLVHDRAPIDVPTAFGPVAERLSEADRAVLAISSRFYDEKAMGDLRRMIDAEPTDLDEEINTLPPDASEGTRQCLAEKVAPIIAQHQRDFPWLKDPRPRLTKDRGVVERTAARSINDLYNEAQRDVIRRALLLLEEGSGAPAPSGEPEA